MAEQSFSDFKRWVVSLSCEELLDAMSFTFQQNTLKNSTISPNGSESHEHELLLSMVQLQSPPSTPVHPRAPGYRSRSHKGARLDYFHKEEECLRWKKPRLFQWIEEDEQYSLLDTSVGKGKRGRMRGRNRKNKNFRRFNVIARQKVSPWGDAYGLGCTQEQIDADFRLIKGTHLGRYRKDGKYHATACFVCTGNFQPVSQDQPSCRNRDEAVEELSPSAILDILRIASRGQIFQECTRSSTSDLSYCAPWLRPTERWFSLGMYLASRFQMALWEAYTTAKFGKPDPLPRQLIRQGGAWNDYNERILQKALMGAIRLSLNDVLKEEQQDARLNFLRDGVIWSIIEDIPVLHRYLADQGMHERKSTPYELKKQWKHVAWTWSHVRLVEVHSPFNTRFKRLVYDKLDDILVTEKQKSIVEELEREGLSYRSKPDYTETPVRKNKRKKNKKDKRRRRNESSKKAIVDQNERFKQSPIPVAESKDEDLTPSTSDLSSLEGNRNERAKEVDSTIHFPKNSTSPRERNRNIIFVLSILEEVTEAAFIEVGLQQTHIFDQSCKNDAVHTPNMNTEENPTNLTSTQKEYSNDKDDVISDYVNFPLIDRSSDDITDRFVNGSRNFYDGRPNQNENNGFSLYTAKPENMTSSLYNHLVVGNDLLLSNIDTVGEEVEHWPFVNRFQSREESILSSFFQSQNAKSDNKDDLDDDEQLMASSTAASIASSSYKDTSYAADEEEFLVPLTVVTEHTQENVEMRAIQETPDAPSKCSECSEGHTELSDNPLDGTSVIEMKPGTSSSKRDDVTDGKETESVASKDATKTTCRSPTLQPPITPPPTLSPIILSPGDLKEVKYDSSFSLKRFPSLDFETTKSISGPVSLPPTSPNGKSGLVSSWSREDLRIESFRDDHNIKSRQKHRIKQRREIDTYKTVVVKTLTKQPTTLKDDTESLDRGMRFSESKGKAENKESCAQSETAIDTHRGDHHDWYREEVEYQSIYRDENTTIVSGISHRVEVEELVDVQEERNHFRDMCLTLGAEVAKLKVMLATQQAAASVPVDFQESSLGYRNMYGHGSFDPHGMQPFFHGAINSIRPGPMSDAGFHRYGDHESVISEDEAHDPGSKARTIDPPQRLTSSHTVTESDVSVDFTSIRVPLTAGQMPGTMSVYNTFQSRLSKDILQFVDATNTKMRQLEGRRKLAVERFSRLVKTVWPRAQVKLYGSYMSGLCLPSSDLDFVVCLPAVHKKDLALAPGVLEGRNAINETSQKLLARELKGESWIDPRSIKVIERTAVPVIKVSTKDTRARMIQLDISFDGPEHHGLEANEMVAQTLEELPLIRPLMLVLKQFLLHRGLLTAYTGGLSSYCLFLMLARYLQEQPPSSSDCGALLMGFLDFYGNCFDPRSVGISVGGRQYFARANSHTAAAGYERTGQPLWNRPDPPHQQHVVINDLPPSSSSVEFRRRNSFSDAGSVDDNRLRHLRFAATPTNSGAGVTSTSTHRFLPRSHTVETNYRSGNKAKTNKFNNNANFVSFDRPSTFDPLFVEDPLSATNNVGRNAFRINQVQRAFSDAHRALVATLDWDIQPAEGSGKYPLLKCLLGNLREV